MHALAVDQVANTELLRVLLAELALVARRVDLDRAGLERLLPIDRITGGVSVSPAVSAEHTVPQMTPVVIFADAHAHASLKRLSAAAQTIVMSCQSTFRVASPHCSPSGQNTLAHSSASSRDHSMTVAVPSSNAVS